MRENSNRTGAPDENVLGKTLPFTLRFNGLRGEDAAFTLRSNCLRGGDTAFTLRPPGTHIDLDIDESAVTPIPLSAGDVSVHSSRLVHGSG